MASRRTAQPGSEASANTRTSQELELREWVLGELLSCYGEGEHTDWPWLNDLVEVVADLIERHMATAMKLYLGG